MIYTFLDELKRCDYTLLNNSTIIEDFKYNGVTYAEGSETYNKLLNNMLTSFKELMIEKSKSVQIEILHELKEISETYYDIPTMDAITQLENDYSRQLIKNKSILFSIRQGKFLKEMNDRKINKGIASICEKTGMRHITLYTARHTFASVAASNGMTAEQIQKFLGHTSSRTTQLYINTLTKNVFRKAIKIVEDIAL